ncbi:MAG: ABC transporter ATP-binding protein [Parachlamydiaceae bacterium]
MDDIAIKVEGVSKTFKLPHEKTSSIKGAFINIFNGKRTYEKQQVLKDISFEIKKGEFFGIVGRNGSGKSTLLKLLAGIYEPNKGSIQINGKLTPFIELGVGFNHELTGRENVFLNGALLGFNRKEMNTMYQEIVDFAEIEKFMDQKLKNYSSGMQVRLAFSIAIRAKSDILLLDEVLAVGDEAFQRKCLDVFDKYKSSGQTIVLVTHDMAIVNKYCSRALLLGTGKITDIGKPNKIASEYTQLNQQSLEASEKIKQSSKPKSILNINVLDSEKKICFRYETGQYCQIKLGWPKDIEVEDAGVALHTSDGQTLFGTNTLHRKIKIRDNSISFRIKLDVLPGKYFFSAGIFKGVNNNIVEFDPEGPSISVSNSTDEQLAGVALLDYEWVEDNE